jgi:hypothetical protein
MRQLSILTLSALAAIAALAQDMKPEMDVVQSYKIKPEMRADFEALQKEISDAYKKAGVPSRIVFQNVLGDLTDYTVVSPIPGFAELDKPSPVQRALGEETYNKLMRRAGAMVTEIHREVAVSRPDLSIITNNEMPGAISLVVEIQPASGRRAELEQIIKTELLPAFKKIGTKQLWVEDVIFGGQGGAMVVIMPMSKMADFDAGPPLVRALGADKAQMLEMRMAPLVASERYSVYKMRPELSCMTTPGSR